MPHPIAKEKIGTTVSRVLAYHEKERRSFPWRETVDPYHILISEYMLQQTQTERVVPKYVSFIERFPEITSLASAARKEVLALWSGLGYNRRAVALHNTAKMVVAVYDGVMPKTKEALLSLPGVGEYTAGAVLAFAYNKPVTIVETNIRTVVFHHCVRKKGVVSDTVISYFVEQLLQTACNRGIAPRIFYSAMMDYGSYLKSQGVRTNVRSKHYTKQSNFAGSVRQARGALLRHLIAADRGVSKKQLQMLPVVRIDDGLAGLLADGLVEKRGKYYYLKDA
ncbi:MAG: A/G-specific adenine glycosylase [Candidatus Kaiserbacteria bacterium]|nr:A/G-specific adenine glycosylase [Candidatus Kaiserbacteria bacterium]